MFSCEPKRSIYVDGHLFWFWSQQCNSCKLQLHKRKYMNKWISKGETRFYLQDTTQRSTLSCLVIFCFTAVLRTKAIFSKICVPCDIKHRLQTMWNDLFLVLLVLNRIFYFPSHGKQANETFPIQLLGKQKHCLEDIAKYPPKIWAGTPPPLAKRLLALAMARFWEYFLNWQLYLSNQHVGWIFSFSLDGREVIWSRAGGQPRYEYPMSAHNSIQTSDLKN